MLQANSPFLNSANGTFGYGANYGEYSFNRQPLVGMTYGGYGIVPFGPVNPSGSGLGSLSGFNPYTHGSFSSVGGFDPKTSGLYPAPGFNPYVSGSFPSVRRFDTLSPG